MARERFTQGAQKEHAYLHDHSPFDRMMDGAFAAVGIAPEAVEAYLSQHKKGARIAANTTSLTRVVLGELVMRKYEKACQEKNKKAIVGCIIGLAGIMVTDGIDGYICRKAGIDGSKSGKIIDSAADVYLRARIAKSSIFTEIDAVDKTRLGGEALVAWSAIPDMLKGRYTSTDLGKIKVPADAVATLAAMVKELLPEDSSGNKSLRVVFDGSRVVGAGLAIVDGAKRLRKTKSNEKSI